MSTSSRALDYINIYIKILFLYYFLYYLYSTAHITFENGRVRAGGTQRHVAMRKRAPHADRRGKARKHDRRSEQRGASSAGRADSGGGRRSAKGHSMRFAYHEPMDVRVTLAMWSKREGAMPDLSGPSAASSVFLPLGNLDKEENTHHEEKFMKAFTELYFEHIPGFKKAKKEKSSKERNMEWRMRLAEKRKRDAGGDDRSKSISSDVSRRSLISSIGSSNNSAYFYVTSSRPDASAMSDGGALNGTGKRVSKSTKRQRKRKHETTDSAASAAQTRENAIAAYKAMKHKNTSMGNARGRGMGALGSTSSGRQYTKEIIKRDNDNGRDGAGSSHLDPASGVGSQRSAGMANGKKRMSKAERKRMAKQSRTKTAANSTSSFSS